MDKEQNIQERMLNIEKWKAEIDIWRTNEETQRAFDSIVHYAGQSAMRIALIINGGAAVAILAFIGSLFSNGMQDTVLMKEMAQSMLFYTIGILIVAISFGLIYLGLYFASFDSENITGFKSKIIKTVFSICNYTTWILVVASYVLFLLGFLNAYCSFVGICNP